MSQVQRRIVRVVLTRRYGQLAGAVEPYLGQLQEGVDLEVRGNLLLSLPRLPPIKQVELLKSLV